MDLAFWGFRRWPFERTYAADRFFASQQHDEALARLLYLTEETNRTGILTGPAGAGKSFLLRQLQQQASRQGRTCVRVDATGLDGSDLQEILADQCLVGCEANATMSRRWTAMQRRFEALAVIRQPLVITIDHLEEHESSGGSRRSGSETSCAQTVRRVRKLADAVGMNLTLIIATREACLPVELHDLVELRIDLEPLNRPETGRFVEFCLAQSASSKLIFSEESLDLIHQRAQGIPARIVTLCNLALLAARVQDQQDISPELVLAVGDEMAPTAISTPRSDGGRSLIPAWSR